MVVEQPGVDQQIDQASHSAGNVDVKIKARKLTGGRGSTSPLSLLWERAREKVETLRCNRLIGTHTPSPPPLSRQRARGAKSIACLGFMEREE